MAASARTTLPPITPIWSSNLSVFLFHISLYGPDSNAASVTERQHPRDGARLCATFFFPDRFRRPPKTHEATTASTTIPMKTRSSSGLKTATARTANKRPSEEPRDAILNLMMIQLTTGRRRNP
jgi:hypothetical protein